jgi:CheY-like chemotaxis protein/signal transduction histidine kinase
MTVARRDPSRGRDPLWMWIAVAAIAGAVFAADLITSPGINVWICFIPAVVLCKLLTWKPLAPLGVAVATSGLVIAGYFLQEPRSRELAEVGSLNRGIGVGALLLLGLMGRQFVVYRARVRTRDWVRAGQNELARRMRGEHPLAELGKRILSFLGEYLDAQVGAMYAANTAGAFAACAGFARGRDVDTRGQVFAAGEGLVGQAAADKRVMVIDDIPEGYVEVRSGLGAAPPRSLILVPTHAEGVVNGVFEFGFFSPPAAAARELLDSVAETIGFALRSATYRERQAELLEESQRQGEALHAQQEELRSANEELEEQTERLKTSQEQLEETNAQLEEQTQTLESQKDAILAAQRLLQQKATDVDRASRYKSEFLANMSHELRTPLNSSLILAKLLMDNKEGNLSAEQTRYAQSIYAAGNDLLTLINDILDLAKIEAGKVELSVETVRLARIVDNLRRRFEPVAAERKLELRFTVDPGCPETIESDPHRLQQILTNLLANALKFTERGSVKLQVAARNGQRIAVTVEDTGIGIPAEQHEVIFEAFRQADGTTIRKYGGTGLGLSICRELVALLGGEIHLRSAPGQGSTFTVVLPLRTESIEVRPREQRKAQPATPRDGASTAKPMVVDDRDDIADPRRVVLIVDDDPVFAEILRDLGRELGFQCVIARDGGEGLALARQYHPVAVLLDIGLPDQSGLTVLELLKRDPSTRHVPIHIASVHDYEKVARELGAVGYALKPVKREQLVAAFRLLEERLSRKMKRVLVIEDDAVQRDAIVDLLKVDDVEVVATATAEEGLAQLRASTFDCCVLDLRLPDLDGFGVLERMANDDQSSFPPVIVYTALPLSRDEEQRLRRSSSSVIVKGARSPERLLEEVTLFLHQVESDLPPERQRMLRLARDRESIFEGCRVLLVEDDVRNLFALTRVLEPKGVAVEVARNGKEALARLADGPNLDLVLMDIMMPEMDGLTAMRAIRRDDRWRTLPIIALTAKAMPDDRKACLDAGANDYIAKPVEVDKLLSLLRVWMPR